MTIYILNINSQIKSEKNNEHIILFLFYKNKNIAFDKFSIQIGHPPICIQIEWFWTKNKLLVLKLSKLKELGVGKLHLLYGEALFWYFHYSVWLLKNRCVGASEQKGKKKKKREG